MTVIGFAGGKSKACKKLWEIFHRYYPECDLLVSPFFGGGSFEMFVQKKTGAHVFANDCDARLMDFWRYFQSNRNDFINAVVRCPRMTYEKFHEIRKRILKTNSNAKTRRQRAIDFYLLNRCSFGALTLAGGFADSMADAFHNRSKESLRKVDVEHIDFVCGDWKPFCTKALKIARANKLESVMFLDPPYYFGRRMRMYGRDGDVQNSFDHERLYDYLKTKKNWMLCYNNCEHIRKLYGDKSKFIQIPCRWQYTMTQTSRDKTNARAMPELVILPRS
jgi:DNA adenine methylase